MQGPRKTWFLEPCHRVSILPSSELPAEPRRTGRPGKARQRLTSGRWVLFVIQSLSPVRLCDPMDCSTPGLPVHLQLQSLLNLMSTESVMPSNHLILCRPLLLLPSVFSSIGVFFSESALRIRWPKYQSFSLSISHSSEYSGLISSTTIGKHQFFSAQPSKQSSSHPYVTVFSSLRWFTKYTEMDYARAGNKATFTVNLDPGPLEQFPHSMEPQLRQLGLPTALKKGRGVPGAESSQLRAESAGFQARQLSPPRPHLSCREGTPSSDPSTGAWAAPEDRRPSARDSGSSGTGLPPERSAAWGRGF